MELFENKEDFTQIVKLTSEYFGIDAAIVEKDYFVTLFLKCAKNSIPGLVFKGGTSLSKCYKIIDRFSEDLDLTLDIEHFTQSQKRNSIKALINICDSKCFKLLNRNQIEIRTHRNYNCYQVEYPSIFYSNNIFAELKVEMTYIQKSYPTDTVKASSYITDFLMHRKITDIISEYELEPFDIQVQSLDRTLIDKIFALGDYYLSGKTYRNSRHIYDISKLLDVTDITAKEFRDLVKNVREIRKSNKTCLSAQDNINMKILLEEIISKEAFKKDYEEVTMKLLTKPVEYQEAIDSLKKIIESRSF